MTTEEIDKLLEGTNDINNAILARIENEKSNGKYFNVFNILGLWSEEVRLHSSFLAELLNPKGNHGCGIIFLQEFISLFIKRKTEISYETAETFVEFSIGTISKDKTRGGRLDIFIYFPVEKFSIIIENKIYADDQEYQLLRYYNYAESKFGPENYKLFYLTLDGHCASKKSTGSKDFSYDSLSYQTNILEWLSKCREKASNDIVKYTIYQYENLIKMITNQYMGAFMNDKEKNMIQKKLLENNNLLLVELLVSQLDDTKEKIFKDFIIPELKTISVIQNTKVIFGSTLDEENGTMNHSESGFWFYVDEQKSKYVSFIFDTNNYQNLYYGINKDSCKKKALINNLKQYGFKENSYWAGWKYLSEQRNFSTEDFILYKDSPKKFKDLIVQKLDELVPLLIE